MTFAAGCDGISDGDAMGADGEGSVRPITESPQSTHTSTLSRPGRLRSRTSTFSYTPPLPPVMSRENSSEELSTVSALPSSTLEKSEAGPSKPRQHHGRYTPSRPHVANIRTTSYNAVNLSAPRTPISPNGGGGDGAVKVKMGLKRRISTPIIANINLDEENPSTNSTYTPSSAPPPKNNKSGELPSRARATSTSHVNPSATLDNAPPTIPVPTLPRRPASRPAGIILPQPGISFTPPSPEGENDTPILPSKPSILERAYNSTETSLRRITSLFRPSNFDRSPPHSLQRRGSDEDSEKGLNGDDDSLLSGEGDLTETTGSRSSTDTDRIPRPARGRYWGIWASGDKALISDQDPDGYFSLPPTPPDTDLDTRRGSQDFAEALLLANGKMASLPTPAISAHSLSRGRSPERAKLGVIAGIVAGWGRGKTGAVLRELGWTVGILILGFFSSLGVALWLLKSLPITTLRHLPKSTTDVQLLSAEIKTYMTSSDIGWYHTVGVLTFVGCWKHAWSVPGAIVLNILVGSLLSPIPALGLLTFITATGSLGCYLLSRPLAPLIAVLFPKPLSLVRAALAPESSPPAVLSTHTHPVNTEHVTPINLANPSDPSIGSHPSTTSNTKPNIWRRLLIMRAMGIVPWSGMNVACGVVGVDWKTFWLTTAAGSASWSYVTASIGDLLARLAIPSSAGATAGVDSAKLEGESLTAMLRDPALIAKLVFLTALTLIPAFLKRSSSSGIPTSTPKSTTATSISGIEEKRPIDSIPEVIITPVSPTSPLAQSLARFTPTPAGFDFLSFGRTVLRTGAGAAGAGIRQVGVVFSKIAGR